MLYLVPFLMGVAFAITSVGFGTVLVPVLIITGHDPVFSKVLGLSSAALAILPRAFVNFTKDFKRSLIIALLVVVASKLGVLLAIRLPVAIVNVITGLTALLVVVARRFFEISFKGVNNFLLYIAIFMVAFWVACAGITGGILYVPFLAFFGFDIKLATSFASVAVFVGSCASSVYYAAYLPIEWTGLFKKLLLFWTMAFLGGLVGTGIAGKVSAEKFSKIMDVIIVILAAILLIKGLAETF